MTRYVTSNRLHRLRAELTERDWQVVNTVGRMRVASASQLKALHLADVAHRHAQRTLTSLVRRRVLARLPRMVGGGPGEDQQGTFIPWMWPDSIWLASPPGSAQNGPGACERPSWPTAWP